MTNLLIKGENLDALNFLLSDMRLRSSIDLIYTDPPFATGNDFAVSEQRASSVGASKNAIFAYSDRLKGNEFINFLRDRLIPAKMLLSNEGSIYLHTDYKIGPYIRVMMDKVFGMENFRNDITRIKCNPKNFSRLGYGNIKDEILFYTVSDSAIWNEPSEAYSTQDIERLFKKVDENGRRYTTVPLHAPGESKNPVPFKGQYPPEGRHWRTSVETMEKWDELGLIEWSKNGVGRKKIYAEEHELKGKRIQDIWTDFKDPQKAVYPTEKNIDLIKRIIRTSSNEDSIVLDFFCGSGTTLKAANDLGRKWIGIDNSDQAIAAAEKKLQGIEYEVIDLTELRKSLAL